MKFNPAFISNIHDIHGDFGDLWLKDLPNRIQHLATLWNFRYLKPMSNLSYNFVGLVQMNLRKQLAILKMAPETGTLIPEMRWLTCIEEGVPEIYAIDESLNAYLMEHLTPGHTLKKLVRDGNDDAATKIICQTIRNIERQHKSDYKFRHFSDLAKILPILEGNFDARLLSNGIGMFHDLTQDRTQDVLLHGDLHHDNILSSGTRWKAIDPHGYVGDPCAEVGAMIRNALNDFPTSIPLSTVLERRLRILAEELPFDGQRIKSWAFCITVLSGAWSFEDHGEVPDLVVEVATALDRIQV